MYRRPSLLWSLTHPPSDTCLACEKEKHPLYVCTKFKSLPHANKLELLRAKNCCLNCLRPGHIAKKCKSLNHCKQCKRPHHTLLHMDSKRPEEHSKEKAPVTDSSDAVVSPVNHVSVHPHILLMTCKVHVESPGGTVQARALLDSGSSASFISERLAQSLHLRRFKQNAKICGIAGLQHSDGKQSVTQFIVSSMYLPDRRHGVNAFIVPQITSDLPVCPISPHQNWKHLDGLSLADPDSRYANSG